MTKMILTFLLFISFGFTANSCNGKEQRGSVQKETQVNSADTSVNTNGIYQFKVKDIEGNDISLSKYKNQALLIVNVASECGFTPQYFGLEKLYRKYKPQGFAVLGFPSNEFGGQEPGNNRQIKEFCTVNYDVTFPLFSKIDVNGKNPAPLYSYLKKEKQGPKGADIDWNFTKFLVDKNGNVVKRYEPKVTPEEIEKDVKALVENGSL